MQLDEGFWMRWSDDSGSSFTGGRVVVPVRRFLQLLFLKSTNDHSLPLLLFSFGSVANFSHRTEIDRTNPWSGRTIGAFCCDKPQVIDGKVFFAFQKTPDGNGESYGSEVFFMRSPDLVRLAQAGKMEEATWETLPKGERGLQTRQGLLLGEEPHVLQVIGCLPYSS